MMHYQDMKPVADLMKREYRIDRDRAMRLWPGFRDYWGPEEDFGMGFKQPEWVQKAHNTKSGRIFIFGTGPSLAKQLPLLKRWNGDETWTVNRMARWKELPFVPTHHSVTEPGPIENWGKRILQMYDFPLALNRIAVHWFPVTAPGWLWCAKAVDDIQVRWEGAFGCGDYLPPLPSAWASPLTVSQLAAWIGYQEIVFLGIDTTQEGQAWDITRGRTTYARSILTILECADRIYHTFTKAGRKVYDCTPGGRINQEGIFPYVRLEEVLGVAATN